jgi:hypothetical protein
MQNFDHDIGSWEKRQFFRRKLAKIAENYDHNIDPRFGASWYYVHPIQAFVRAIMQWLFLTSWCLKILESMYSNR